MLNLRVENVFKNTSNEENSTARELIKLYLNSYVKFRMQVFLLYQCKCSSSIAEKSALSQTASLKIII